MLINLLIKKQQKQVEQCCTLHLQRQHLRLAYLSLLAGRSKQFLGSAPGLTLSFCAGVLLQFRHHTAVKTVRRLGALHWLRHLV